MARLPQPGGDNGNWGNVLNDYLSQAHRSDGTLKDGAVSEENLSTAIRSKIDAKVDAADAVAESHFWAANLLARLAPATTLPIPATAVSDDVPVITSGDVATVTGQIVGVHSGQVTEVGSRGVWNPTYGRLGVSGKSGFDFFLTGDTVEIYGLPNITGVTRLWVWVNGAPTSVTPVSISTTAGTQCRVKLVFPSVKRRRIEFFMPSMASFYDVRTTLSSLITPAPRKPVVAFVGDSFWSGSSGTEALLCGDFLMSRMLGVECFSLSYGGTGYVNGGVPNVFGSTNRVSSVAAGNPELILMQGSVNDDGQSGIQAAATAAYAAYAEACPNAKIIVFGPQPGSANSTLHPGRAANIAAVKAAASAAPNVLAFHDMVGTASGVPPAAATYQTYPSGTLLSYLGSVWKVDNGDTDFTNGPLLPNATSRFVLQTYAYTGTGTVDSPAGNGTRDTYLYGDGTHPMPEGSAALAITEANLIRADLLAAMG